MSTTLGNVEIEEMTFAAAIKATLAEEMRRDPAVFLMGEDIKYGVWGTTAGLQNEQPDRVLHLPISENGFCCAAVGAALTGMRPVVELMFADFALLALDALGNQAAKYRYMCGGDPFKVPMVVKLAGSGIGSGSGCHHSQTTEALFMHFPGLKVVTPSTPAEAKGLLASAIRDDNPVVFVEAKLLYPETGPVPKGDYTIPLGQAHIAREGTDITLVSHSYALVKTLAAAESLAGEGISAEVISLRTLVPLDKAAVLESVA
ncbi:MAG: transketolase C-terminal domain-containing protein, partial [Bacillota bacterium]|nr:transketolase C-terminal domain-containing protein [Bacillota bacterium]